MKLRKLEDKDAPYMKEWMKDKKVNCFFRFDPDSVTSDSVRAFIKNSQNTNNSYHFAIADEEDTYLGTVSLKNIDMDAKSGEYAIALRACAQGKGAGRFATYEILKFAFEKLGLNRVYLNVLSDNEKAIKFYQKIGFICEGEFYQHVYIKGELKSLKWFRMMKDEYENLIKCPGEYIYDETSRQD
jgi:diamine N-acetyltransferase